MATKSMAGFLLLAAAFGPAVLGAEPYVRQRAEEPKTLYCFAILGEVQSPGVYAYETPSPSVNELVRRAGGMTGNATGNLNVVRPGGAAQPSGPQAGASYSLQPGDVVVLPGQPAAGERDTITTAEHFGAGDSSNAPVGAQQQVATVQIALLNLLQYPVIIPVRAEDATLERIVAGLGQLPRVAMTVETITAGAGEVEPDRTAPPSAPLPSGTVLVFNPRAIDYNRLVPLPVPVSAEPILTPAVPPYVDEAPSVAEHGESFPIDPETRTPAPIAMADESSAMLEEPGELDASPAIAEPLPSAADSFSAGVKTKTAAAAAPAKSNTTLTVLFAMLFCAAVGTTVVAIRKQRGVPAVKTPATPAPASNVKAIIKDILPLVEEPCALESLQEFYGRATGPAKLRIDQPQAMTGPHFPLTPVQQEQEPAESFEIVEEARVEAVPAAAPAKPARRHTVHAAHEFVGQGHGLLDRVLATTQKAVR